MSPTDLDPAAIMADHHGEPDEWCFGQDYDCPEMWPCTTYRLAAALVEAQEREQRVRIVADQFQTRHQYPSFSGNYEVDAAASSAWYYAEGDLRAALDGKP